MVLQGCQRWIIEGLRVTKDDLAKAHGTSAWESPEGEAFAGNYNLQRAHKEDKGVRSELKDEAID